MNTGIAKEPLIAYKDIHSVLDVVHDASLPKRVARVALFKGNSKRWTRRNFTPRIKD